MKKYQLTFTQNLEALSPDFVTQKINTIIIDYQNDPQNFINEIKDLKKIPKVKVKDILLNTNLKKFLSGNEVIINNQSYQLQGNNLYNMVIIILEEISKSSATTKQSIFNFTNRMALLNDHCLEKIYKTSIGVNRLNLFLAGLKLIKNADIESQTRIIEFFIQFECDLCRYTSMPFGILYDARNKAQEKITEESDEPWQERYNFLDNQIKSLEKDRAAANYSIAIVDTNFVGNNQNTNTYNLPDYYQQYPFLYDLPPDYSLQCYPEQQQYYHKSYPYQPQQYYQQQSTVEHEQANFSAPIQFSPRNQIYNNSDKQFSSVIESATSLNQQQIPFSQNQNYSENTESAIQSEFNENSKKNSFSFPKADKNTRFETPILEYEKLVNDIILQHHNNPQEFVKQLAAVNRAKSGQYIETLRECQNFKAFLSGKKIEINNQPYQLEGNLFYQVVMLLLRNHINEKSKILKLQNLSMWRARNYIEFQKMYEQCDEQQRLDLLMISLEIIIELRSEEREFLTKKIISLECTNFGNALEVGGVLDKSQKMTELKKNTAEEIQNTTLWDIRHKFLNKQIQQWQNKTKRIFLPTKFSENPSSINTNAPPPNKPNIVQSHNNSQHSHALHLQQNPPPKNFSPTFFSSAVGIPSHPSRKRKREQPTDPQVSEQQSQPQYQERILDMSKLQNQQEFQPSTDPFGCIEDTNYSIKFFSPYNESQDLEYTHSHSYQEYVQSIPQTQQQSSPNSAIGNDVNIDNWFADASDDPNIDKLGTMK